ncbi:unnamed protein product [Choristocarpus tenellus]
MDLHAFLRTQGWLHQIPTEKWESRYAILSNSCCCFTTQEEVPKTTAFKPRLCFNPPESTLSRKRKRGRGSRSPSGMEDVLVTDLEFDIAIVTTEQAIHQRANSSPAERMSALYFRFEGTTYFVEHTLMDGIMYPQGAGAASDGKGDQQGAASYAAGRKDRESTNSVETIPFAGFIFPGVVLKFWTPKIQGKEEAVQTLQDVIKRMMNRLTPGDCAHPLSVPGASACEDLTNETLQGLSEAADGFRARLTSWDKFVLGTHRFLEGASGRVPIMAR